MKKINIWAIALVLFVFALWITTFALLWFDKKEGLGEIGQFGDMFGSTNALFSGLAFVGIIVTIIIQSRELELQRQELRETKNIFEKQSVQLKFQQRENTFFNLLAHHNKIIDGITDKQSAITRNDNSTYLISGYEALRSQWRSTKYNLKNGKHHVQRELVYSIYDVNDRHPWRVVSKNDNYRKLYNSVLHILSFIRKQLNNEIFYYESLFNNLSAEEREIISLLNEYHEYIDSEKINFSDYPLKFDANIEHLDWFTPAEKLPPLVDLIVDDINIPINNIADEHYESQVTLSFEDNVRLLNLMIMRDEVVLRECKTYNQEVKKYEVVQHLLTKEDIRHIKIDKPDYKSPTSIPSQMLCVTMIYRAREFTIFCAIRTSKSQTHSQIHFSY